MNPLRTSGDGAAPVHATPSASTPRSAGSATETATGRPRAAAPRSAAAPDHLRRPGSVVGRYTLLAPAGRGAMGVVFTAIDRELDRKVAIKLLLAPPSATVDVHRRARLLREARAIAAISHPNVVGVFDVGVDRTDVYIVMEWIDGVELRRWLTVAERTVPQIVEAMTQAARGLAAAHAAGIVHRDFKPANVMVGRDGRVRVLDFGLARAGRSTTDHTDDPGDDLGAGGPPHLDALTRPGDRPGTPAYMSPEQHLGSIAGAASDQFAWGVALHEAIFGFRPFLGDGSAAIASAVVAGTRAPLPRGHRVPPWLLRIIDRALSLREGDRFATMAAVVAAIERGQGRGRWRRWLLAPAVVAVGVAGLARLPAAPEVTGCDARWRSAVLDPDARAEVLGAFADDPQPIGDDGPAFVSRLQARGAAIDDAARTTCEAHARGQIDRTTLDRRLTCVEGQRHQLATFAQAVTRGDANAREHARTAIAALPAPSECASEDRTPPPVPGDPDIARGVIELRERIADATLYRQLGRSDTALSLAHDALVRARALGYPPVVAEALLAVGENAQVQGELALAEQALRDAAWLAEAEGHDHVRVEALTELAWLRVVELRHYDEVDALTTAAGAAARRWGDDGYHAILLNVRAAALEALGDRAGATATMREVVATLRRDAAGFPTLSNALHNLGNYLLTGGDLTGAATSYAEALAISRAAVGDDHPEVYGHRQALADTELMAGNYAGAVGEYEAVLRYRERVHGPHDPRLATTLNNLGHALVELGRVEDGRVALERALALKLAADASDASLGNTCVFLGRAYTELGRLDDALLLLGRAALHRSDLAPEDTKAVEVADAIDAAVARWPADQPPSATAREIVAAAARRAAIAGDAARAARLGRFLDP